MILKWIKDRFGKKESPQAIDKPAIKPLKQIRADKAKIAETIKRLTIRNRNRKRNKDARRARQLQRQYV